MRPVDFCILQPRLISTLAPPPTTVTSKTFLPAPPLLVANKRTRVDGSFVLLSSLEPDVSHTTRLGPARQITRYKLTETANSVFSSLAIQNARRRFTEPELGTNVERLGALWNPYISRRPHLYDMLMACLGTAQGVRSLFEADVVAERGVITKLMSPHKAAFNASFAHGVLFLEEAFEPSELKLTRSAVHRQLGFFRACTEMFEKGRPEPTGRFRHALHTVVARPLGGLNLLMSDRVDCITSSEDDWDPACYLQFVNRPFRDGKYVISPRICKRWYLRAHLMGIRALYLGLIDEAGVLRDTRRVPVRTLPAAVAEAGDSWNPQENIRWAFRVLDELRDYCQEEMDLRGPRAMQQTFRDVWRVEINPLDGPRSAVSVLVRLLSPDERRKLPGLQRYGLVPTPVIKAYDDGYP